MIGPGSDKYEKAEQKYEKEEQNYEVWGARPWATTIANLGENSIVPECHLSLTKLMNLNLEA